MVGLGEIGAEIVKRLRSFEMEIIYMKRNRLSEAEEAELGVTWEPDRDELLRSSDFVVVMTTYNATTHKMFGEREFELMKPTAFFVRAMIRGERPPNVVNPEVYGEEPIIKPDRLG